MKAQTVLALSLGLASLLAGASCAGNGHEQSGVNASDAPPAAFPVAIAVSDTDAAKYFVYVPSQGGETGFNYCLDNSLDDCKRGTGAKAMTTFKDPKDKKFYVFGPLALTDGSKINMVSVNGTSVLKTRAISLSSGGAAVTLESPKERQVFQRETADKGKIIVLLKSDSTAKFVRAKVSGTAKSNNVVGDGQFKEYEVTSSRAAVDAPAGGWFTLDVVLLDAAKKAIGQAQIKEVGIGEVFLVAGQSNSTNCGRARQTVDNDFVVSTDGKAWQKGDDPQLGTHDDHICNSTSGHGGSNWPNTGNALVAKYKVPVAFASTGYSGTAIKEWVPTYTQGPAQDNKSASLFEYTARRAEQLQVGGFRAVLWHQGENDGSKDKTAGDVYEKALGEVITGLRSRTKVNNPWLIAVASWCFPGSYGGTFNGGSDDITGAQQRIVTAKTIPDLFAGPSTDDLREGSRGTTAEPTDCHFNDPGLKEVGKRWADKIIAFLDTKVGAGDTAATVTPPASDAPINDQTEKPEAAE